MANSISESKAKYARKTAAGAAKWNAAKGRMSQNYASGVARWLGQSPSGTVVSNFQAGIAAANYRGGDPDKWERNTIAGLTGG